MGDTKRARDESKSSKFAISPRWVTIVTNGVEIKYNKEERDKGNASGVNPTTKPQTPTLPLLAQSVKVWVACT